MEGKLPLARRRTDREAGFVPDSISTDLHIGSMNAGMKDMLNVMSKFLAMGMSLDDVIARSTWNPAKEIRQEDSATFGRAPRRRRRPAAGTGQLRLRRLDGVRMPGGSGLGCELTLRAGDVVFDLNGVWTKPDWDTLPNRLRCPPGNP